MEYALLARWLVAFAVLTAAGLPIASVLCPRYPRRGAGLSVSVALLVFVLAGYYVGHVAYGTPALVAAVLVLFATSAVAYRLGGRIDWTAGLEVYAVFLAGYGLLLLFRAYDPTFHAAGGEKYLHFGVLQAVGRAGTLPPEDMWYAGEPIAYYYGIPVMTDLLSMATGTVHRYSYNLALPAYFGAFVAATYTLAGALSHARGHSRVGGGVLGVLFVCLGGFLSTPARLLFGALPREFAVEYGYPVFAGIRHYDYPESISMQGDPFAWGWFYDRYVVQGALTEFPLFGYIKGDMHGQNVTLAWLVLAAALGFAYYRAAPEQRRRRLALAVGVFPILGGFHGVSNTWSMPAVAGIAWLSFTFAPAHPATLLPDRLETAIRDRERDGSESLEELVRPVLAAVLAAVVFVVSYVLAGPFLFFNTPQNEGVGLLPPRTELVGALLLWGAFLALFVAFFLTRDRLPRPRSTGERGAVLGAALVGAILIALTDVDTLVVFAPVLAVGWYLLRRDETVGYETVLLVGGVGLILAMDLVYARVAPFDVPRWNTTFKVSPQAWTLSGLAAAPIAATLLAEALETLRSSAPATARSVDARARAIRERTPQLRAVATIGLVALLLVASGSFAAMAVGHHVEDEVRDSPDRYPSTDGLVAYDTFHPEVMEGVYYLDAQEGRPVLVSAPGRNAYTMQNPAATFTGYPTVVGWEHVRNHRSDEAFESRAAEVDTVYTGPWREAAAVLLKYEVDYVWIGPNEREMYDDVRSFGDHEWADLVVYNDEVEIYEIDRDALEAAVNESTDSEGADG